MKKTYEKPLVAVENFVLSQAISACDIKIGPNGSSNCVIADTDSTSDMVNYAISNWFISKVCYITAIDTESHDSICYHTSTGVGAFTSV